MTAAIQDPAKCPWCGGFHTAKCPLVKSIEYENQNIKRVEFFAPNDYPAELKISWPMVTAKMSENGIG